MTNNMVVAMNKENIESSMTSRHSFLVVGGLPGVMVWMAIFVNTVLTLFFSLLVFIHVRRNRVYPKELIHRIKHVLADGELGFAMEACVPGKNPLSRILFEAFKNINDGFDACYDAMQIAVKAETEKLFKPVRALIVGVPNVGKSTLVNTLMNRAVAAVGDKPAVTKAQQQVVLKNGMVIWDSPGVMWPNVEDEGASLRLALAGSIPPTAIDFLTVAIFGAALLLERYPDRLRARFKLGELPTTGAAIVEAVGRARGCLRTGGVVDLHKAAEILVHDVRSGALGRISLESPPRIPDGLAVA